MEDQEKKLSILQLVPALNTGGVEKCVVEISQALVKNNFISYIASAGGSLLKYIILQGAKHYLLPFDRKNPISFFICRRGLKKILLSEHIDLIHAKSRFPAWIGYYIARQRGLPFITTFHGVYNFRSSFKKYYNSIMTRGERVIAVSNFVRDHILENYNIDKNKVTVIHRGVDLSIFAPDKVPKERVIRLAEKIMLRNFDKTIIMLPGRITRWKGHHLLIEALFRISKQDFICLFVGEEKSNSSYKKQLMKTIKDYHLEDKFVFTGNLSDMAAAYQLADIVISASIEPEAFGRVVTEGQAMGRLVLATNLGGSRETILDQKTGFLFEPNVDSLLETLEKVMKLSFEEKQEVQNHAISHIREKFSLTTMTEKTLGVYRAAIFKENK